MCSIVFARVIINHKSCYQHRGHIHVMDGLIEIIYFYIIYIFMYKNTYN